MSQKIIVPVCVGFAVVASCAAGAFFLAKSPKGQSPQIAGAPARVLIDGVTGTQIDKSQAGLIIGSPDRAAEAGMSTILPPQTGVQTNSGVQDPRLVAALPQAPTNAQVSSGPAALTQAVGAAAVAPAPIPRRDGVTVPPMPQTHQPSVQAALPPAPPPPQAVPPISEPKAPQSVEAVVVTGQRPQQMARTDIDAIGRGNSLTIQLPKRRK
jgi:hypothetical protein